MRGEWREEGQIRRGVEGSRPVPRDNGPEINPVRWTVIKLSRCLSVFVSLSLCVSVCECVCGEERLQCFGKKRHATCLTW